MTVIIKYVVDRFILDNHYTIHMIQIVKRDINKQPAWEYMMHVFQNKRTGKIASIHTNRPSKDAKGIVAYRERDRSLKGKAGKGTTLDWILIERY